jgi:RsiW-degrading membrane proteinase PrsW (M82 family)
VIQQMLDFLPYFFASPSVLGWGLAVIFGAIWLACYRPPLISKPWLWAVLAAGAVVAPIAIAVTVFPLRAGITWVCSHLWSTETIAQWTFLLSALSMFLWGLVREGFKLLPVVGYWWYEGKGIDPKLGLVVGAISGAGFGILESQWTLNYIIASGWSWDAVQIQGITVLAGFSESFFMVGIHIASCALAGWGLARGWGWQFYLLAAFIYLVPNYSYVLTTKELITGGQAELLIAVWALVVTGVALWLRERKSKA